MHRPRGGRHARRRRHHPQRAGSDIDRLRVQASLTQTMQPLLQLLPPCGGQQQRRLIRRGCTIVERQRLAVERKLLQTVAADIVAAFRLTQPRVRPRHTLLQHALRRQGNA